MSTLLVTGVHSALGRGVARQAAALGYRVIGVDRKPAPRALAGVEFVQADVNNPLIGQWMKAEGVDILFHSAFRWRVRPAPETFENNVVGTTKLLEAAADAGVKKIVFPSSTFVYGAHPDHPYLIPEDAPFRGPSACGYVRDLRDIETFLRGFRQQRPEMIITVLRFANLLGHGHRSPLARYLSLPVIPIPKNADPLIQVLHVDDAVRAVIQALEADHDGAYNVAAPPPLTLLQVIERAGRHAVPLPDAILQTGQNLTTALSTRRQVTLPIPWDYLRYSWAVSTRRMRETWGFTPERDADAVLEDFARDLEVEELPEALSKAIAAGKKALLAFSSSLRKPAP